MNFKYEDIVIICRGVMGLEKICFSGNNAHCKLADYANTPFVRNKEILVVEADGMCLYSKLAADSPITWPDLAEFFSPHPSEVKKNA